MEFLLSYGSLTQLRNLYSVTEFILSYGIFTQLGNSYSVPTWERLRPGGVNPVIENVQEPDSNRHGGSRVNHSALKQLDK